MTSQKRKYYDAMIDAAAQNNIPELQRLISTYPNPKARFLGLNSAIGAALLSAIRYSGNYDAIKYLSDLATPNNLEHAFAEAAIYNDETAMQLLFDKGARDTDNAAYAAAEEGHLSSIQKLYELKPPIDPNEIITIANLGGFTDIAQWVIQKYNITYI